MPDGSQEPWVEALMSADHTEFDEPEDKGQEEESESAQSTIHQTVTINSALGSSRKYVAYTIKLPSEQLAALQSIWLELKRLYGAHSPDKSGMIQQAIAEWLKKWDGPERQELLRDLLQIREDTRRRQYRK